MAAPALEVYWRARDVASVPLYFQGIDMGRLAFANSTSLSWMA